jgi:hypothetical protein
MKRSRAITDYEELSYHDYFYDMEELLAISYLDDVFIRSWEGKGGWEDFVGNAYYKYYELNVQEQLPANFKKWYTSFLKNGGIIKLWKYKEDKFKKGDEDYSPIPIPITYKNLKGVTFDVVSKREGRRFDLTIFELMVILLFKKHHCKCPRCGRTYISGVNMFKWKAWYETLITGWCDKCWNEAIPDI